jgi:mono/diheme cytochrome c family protein
MTESIRAGTGTLRALVGILLLALSCGASQALAQAGAADDSLLQQREDRLDPWNQPASNLPRWDLQSSPPPLQPRAKRHLEFIQAGVPVEYRSLRSPYPQAPKVIEDGGDLYRSNCAGCHGTDGRGDGNAGLDLVPSPALLARLMDVQGSVDEYLLWSIAEGGQPFGTAMPAYKDRLTEDQIWQIVAYMRAGFPQ